MSYVLFPCRQVDDETSHKLTPKSESEVQYSSTPVQSSEEFQHRSRRLERSCMGPIFELIELHSHDVLGTVLEYSEYDTCVASTRSTGTSYDTYQGTT